VVGASRYRRRHHRESLSCYFVLDRTGNFEAAYRFLDLLHSKKASVTTRHWYPNIVEWLSFHVMWNRMRAFRFNQNPKYQMPEMSKNEFAGLLQFVFEQRDNVNSEFLVRPTEFCWIDPAFPAWEDKGSGRPPRQQTVAPAVTQLDVEVLSQFLTEAPGKPFAWDVWLNNPEAMKRTVQIVAYCADALTEEVLPEGDTPIDVTNWCGRSPRGGETWPTRFRLNTVRGRITLPVYNTIPAFNLELPDEL
jgi:hypothetical protein